MPAFLTDFGLARAVATGSRYTRTGEALGTPSYMSPEQARGETATLTPATDVWALGCVCYELLAGRRAFEGESAADIVARVHTAEPPALRALRPGLARGCIAVVSVALAKAARHRYPTSRALRDDLDRLLAGRAPVRRVRGRAGAVTGTVSALAASVALASVLAWGGTSRPPAPAGPSRAESLAARATALRMTDPLAAAACLAEALVADPARSDWRLERGLLLWAGGRDAEARREWLTVPASAPEAPRAGLYRGLHALFLLDGPTARAELAPLASLGGADGRLVRGAIAAMLDHEPARALADLADEPGWEAATLRAWAESKRPGGDAAREVREYTLALAEGIPSAWAFTHRGLARKRLGDLAGAIADYSEALRLLPRSAAILVNRGSARLAAGDLAGALADAQAAVTLEPGLAEALDNRALARRRLGDLAGALADVEEALRRKPALVNARENRAHTRLALGDPAGARDDFGECLRQQPADATLWMNRGFARAMCGDPSGGESDLTEAIRLAPEDPGFWQGRARVRFDLGAWALAESDCTAALALAPGHLRSLVLRAALRIQRGDFVGAEADSRLALREDPAWAEAHANLGAALAGRKEWRGAVASLREFLRLAGDRPEAASIRQQLAECEAKLRAEGAGR